MPSKLSRVGLYIIKLADNLVAALKLLPWLVNHRRTDPIQPTIHTKVKSLIVMKISSCVIVKNLNAA